MTQPITHSNNGFRRGVHLDQDYLVACARRAEIEPMPIEIVMPPPKNKGGRPPGKSPRRVIMKNRHGEVLKIFPSAGIVAETFQVREEGIRQLILRRGHQRDTGNTFEYEPRKNHPKGGMKR